MFDQGVVESEMQDAGPTWDRERCEWIEIDRALRGIARRRAALDVEEARWLREAERLRIWKQMGMVSALDYCERALGYSPHVATERLRVARALGELPLIAEAFARGDLAFSGVRELTRVATPATDAKWCDAARDLTVREIEELVAGHKPGDEPDAPPSPDVRTHVVRLEVSGEVYARLRQVRALLADEHGGHLDDDQLVTALCDTALEGCSDGEPSGRAKFQIAVTVCRVCDQGWQDGAGAVIAIEPAAVERARCDAQVIGAIDGDAPERATQDIPPNVVRLVWRRDHGRCQTPGCRSARGLEIHHVVRRADGGSHDRGNLSLRCSSCHLSIHRGLLTVTGTAPDHLKTTRRTEPREPIESTGARSSLEISILTTQVRDALVGLGWKPAIARAAIEAAWSHVGSDVPPTLDALIRAALRACPKPTSTTS
jgi:hypothetical protein